MPTFICLTCGVQHAESAAPPADCAICLDERQYVGWAGQRWTTLAELQAGERRNELVEQEPGLVSLRTVPRFGIGQRALLVRTPAGNVLWDCISYLDDATYRAVRDLGGIRAIAISHPHFYGSNVEWSRAFDAPVYIPTEDRPWVMRPDPALVDWRGERAEPVEGLRLCKLGGHFDGAAALHWPGGAEGRGVLLSGDTIAVSQDRRWVSFMYSYPNDIPLSPAEIERIVAGVRDLPFDRLYGGFDGLVVRADAHAAVERSARRYIARLRGERPQ